MTDWSGTVTAADDTEFVGFGRGGDFASGEHPPVVPSIAAKKRVIVALFCRANADKFATPRLSQTSDRFAWFEFPTLQRGRVLNRVVGAGVEPVRAPPYLADLAYVELRNSITVRRRSVVPAVVAVLISHDVVPVTHSADIVVSGT